MAGTGIQWGGHTTLEAQRAIERADHVLYGVAGPDAARFIQRLNPRAQALPYPTEGRRRQIYLAMVERILEALRGGGRVCAVFYGHPGLLTFAGHEVVRRARAEGFDALMLPGVSSLSCLVADLGVDPTSDGSQVHEATRFLIHPRPFDGHTSLVLFQIGAIGQLEVFDPTNHERIRDGLRVLVDVLRRHFPAEHEVIVYEASTHPLEPPRADRVALAELPNADVRAHSTLYVPAVSTAPPDASMLRRLGMSHVFEDHPPPGTSDDDQGKRR